MPDTVSNPYQPPQSSLERNFRIEGKLGYRDGGHLLVREGFRSPQICVVTGKTVSMDAKAENVMMKSSSKSRLKSGLISGIVIAIIIFWLDVSFEDVLSLAAISTSTIVMIAFLVLFSVIVAFKPSGGIITVYCSPDLENKRKRFKFVTGSLSVIAIIFYFCSGWFGIDSDNKLFCLVGFLLLSHFIQPKKLLKSLGREGDYERFQGAHPNFLDALPNGYEQENYSCSR